MHTKLCCAILEQTMTTPGHQAKGMFLAWVWPIQGVDMLCRFCLDASMWVEFSPEGLMSLTRPIHGLSLSSVMRVYDGKCVTASFHIVLRGLSVFLTTNTQRRVV